MNAPRTVAGTPSVGALLRSAPTRARRFLPAIGIVLLALFLRGWWLADMEFKYDEVEMIRLTAEWLGKGIPTHGMLSGVGVQNPPGFVFLLLPAVAAGASPLALAWGMVLLHATTTALILLLGRVLARPALGAWAAALFAVHPWLILYGRKIWAQSTLPLFVVLVLLIVAQNLRRPRTRAVAALLPVLAFAWQVHFSAWCLVGTAALWIAVSAVRRQLNWRWLLAGALPALLLLAPYLSHLAATGFSDLRAQAAVGAAPHGWRNALLIGHTFIGTAFARGVWNASPMLDLLALAGSVAVFILAASRMRPPTTGFSAWLTVTALLPPALYALRGIQSPPHYFIIGLPALLLLAAEGLLVLPRTLRIAAGGLLLAAGLAIWSLALGDIHHAGGSGGDYGVAYRHQRAAAGFLAQARIRSTDVDASRMRDGGIGVLFLLDRLLPESQARPKGEAIVVDTLRHPDLLNVPFALGTQEARFGPLRVGVAPPPPAGQDGSP